MATRLTGNSNARYGCAQTALDSLIAEKEQLLKQMSSGIQEIDQPNLGRAQYRPMAEMQEALRILEGRIDAATGAITGTSDYRKVRRPIYPVAREY